MKDRFRNCYSAPAHRVTAAQTKPDFMTKVSIARKEARETVHWLRLLAAANLIGPDEIARELSEATQLVAILRSIVFSARLSPRRRSTESRDQE